MENIQKQLDNLSDIKQLMEKSSRFISLSGLSGIFIGGLALIGSAFVYFEYLILFSSSNIYAEPLNSILEIGPNKLNAFILNTGITAFLVLLLSLSFGVLFTIRKAKRNALPIWDSSSKRLLIHLFIPLMAGGIFILALFFHSLFALIAPTSLIFYGLGLINASKYTFKDLKYLGLFDLCLGLLAMFFLSYSLMFWAIGFGLMHIIYGLVMYLKYEK